MGLILTHFLVSVSAFRSSLNIIPGETFKSPCPRSCLEAGPNPRDCDVYATKSQLQMCQQPVLFDFNIHSPLAGNPEYIRACTVWGADFDNPSLFIQSHQGSIETLEATLASWGEPLTPDLDDGISANAASSIRSATQYLEARPGEDQKTIFFASTGASIVGVYVGKGLLNEEVADQVLGPFMSHVLSEGLGDATAIQLCGHGRSVHQTFGVIASTDISKVQDGILRWTNASCVEEPTESVKLDVQLRVQSPQSLSFPSNATRPVIRGRSHLAKRAECDTIKVEPGNGCYVLAERCGISLNDFTKWNPDLCANPLMPEEEVCCSAGDLPDRRPKKNSDGSCAVYESDMDDNCSKIAAMHGLTADGLEDFNEDT